MVYFSILQFQSACLNGKNYRKRMQNLIWGIITVVVSSFVFWYAWKSFKNGNEKLAVLLLILGGVILRVFISTDFYLHEWDERYHALVAKHLINSPLKPMLYSDPLMPFDFREWAGNHIWMHKQPLTLWGLALSLWLFGVNEIALRLPSILLTTLGIWLTFKIAKELFNSRVAFLSAFLFAIHGLILEVTGGRVATDHVDVFFLVFIELAIYYSILFFKRKRVLFNVLAGVFVGFAILSKWLPALIVLPLWILLAIHFKRYSIKLLVTNLVILIVAFIAIAAPWQWYAIHNFPDEYFWESTYNMLHLTTVLGDQGGSWFYHFNKMRINYGELIYLPIIWLLYQTFTNKNIAKYWILVIWIFVPYLFFSFAATKMQGYTLFSAPAIFIVTALFWDNLSGMKNKWKYDFLRKLIMFLLIALPVRFAIERLKPFELRDRNPVWVKDIKSLNRFDEYEQKVVFNMDRNIEAMFYTNFIAYQAIPSAVDIKEIQNLGYQVYVINEGVIPDEIREIENVQIINLELPD